MIVDPRHTAESPDPRDADRSPAEICRDVLKSLRARPTVANEPPVRIPGRDRNQQSRS